MLQHTKQFDKFKFIGENREIDQAHLRALVQDIELNNELHLFPIVVTSKMEVVDGQHRLAAARLLDKPIYYLIDDNFELGKMARINSRHLGWKPKDYLRMYKGNPAYRLVEEVQRKTQWPISAVLSWLEKGDSSHAAARFKAGKLEIDNSEETLELIDKATELMSYMPRDHQNRPARGRDVLNALRIMLMYPYTDHEQLLRKVKQFNTNIDTKKSRAGILQELCRVYNDRLAPASRRIHAVVDKQKLSLTGGADSEG